jgi:polar amino acid transport system substrate-binding protein
MLHRLLLLLTGLLLSGVVNATGQPLLRISAGEWPPYLSARLVHQGPIAHLIRDLLGEEGYQVEFSFLPWPRAYAEAAAGKYDASAVWMHKQDREQDFLFSEPLLDEQFVFFHLKSQPFDWQRFEDLDGMTLGGGLEYSYGAGFDAYLDSGRVRLERVSSDRQNFEKLLKERVVLYPQELNVGYAALRSEFSVEDAARITHHPQPLLVNLSYLLLPRRLEQSDTLRQRFNVRLQQFRQSGRYQQYFDNLQAGHYTPAPATH